MQGNAHKLFTWWGNVTTAVIIITSLVQEWLCPSPNWCGIPVGAIIICKYLSTLPILGILHYCQVIGVSRATSMETYTAMNHEEI